MTHKVHTEQWHISKTIPVSILLAVAVQTTAIVWGAAKLDSRVANIEEWISSNSKISESIMQMKYEMKEMQRDIDGKANKK